MQSLIPSHIYSAEVSPEIKAFQNNEDWRAKKKNPVRKTRKLKLLIKDRNPH
jgi:hypothetical protein